MNTRRIIWPVQHSDKLAYEQISFSFHGKPRVGILTIQIRTSIGVNVFISGVNYDDLWKEYSEQSPTKSEKKSCEAKFQTLSTNLQRGKPSGRFNLKTL